MDYVQEKQETYKNMQNHIILEKKFDSILFPVEIKVRFASLPVEEYHITPLFFKKNVLYLSGSYDFAEEFRKKFLHKDETIEFFCTTLIDKQWKNSISHLFYGTIQEYFIIESVLEDSLSFDFTTDIHFTPNNYGVNISLRRAGIISDLGYVNKLNYNKMLNFMKHRSMLDLLKDKKPQSGTNSWFFKGQEIFLRSSFHPSIFGEKMAIRFLNNLDNIHKLEDLGMPKKEAQSLRNICQKPGLVIAAGATGAGKTTTMYTLLKELALEKKNIITVEDPVEYIIDGICQTEVSTLSYGEALKSALRQDLDVLFVGEIRDEETAKYVMRAAMTGHIVLTTMHLKSADEAINRLIDLGVKETFLKGHLNGVMVQKLNVKDNNDISNDKQKMIPKIDLWINNGNLQERLK